MNKTSYPNINAEYLVALGLLEYILNPQKLINELSQHFSKALVSYNPTDYLPNIDTRTGHAWVNHYNLSEFTELLIKGGFTILEYLNFENTQQMWLLSGRHSSRN